MCETQRQQQSSQDTVQFHKGRLLPKNRRVGQTDVLSGRITNATLRRMFVAQRLGGFGFHVDIDIEFIEVDSLYSTSQIRVKSNTSSEYSIYSFSNDALSMMAAVVSSSESITDT